MALGAQNNDFELQEASSNDLNNEKSSAEVYSDMDTLSADKVCILSSAIILVL